MTISTRVFSGMLFLMLILSLPSSVFSQNQIMSLDVVVSANNTSINSISEKQVRKLFLGKSLTMPDGTRAVLVIYQPLQKMFNKVVLRRSDARVQAAWSRLKFSGRSLEPEIIDTTQALIKFVSDNPNAIGYIPSAEMTADVRSVYTLTY